VITDEERERTVHLRVSLCRRILERNNLVSHSPLAPRFKLPVFKRPHLFCLSDWPNQSAKYRFHLAEHLIGTSGHSDGAPAGLAPSGVGILPSVRRGGPSTIEAAKKSVTSGAAAAPRDVRKA